MLLVQLQGRSAGRTADDGREQFRYLMVAPMLLVEENTVYHVTRGRMIASILCEGLLPSNEAISLTKYPDSFGKIHGSLELTNRLGQGDGAVFWVQTFTERYGEPFGILRVDLTGLPTEGRVYRDAHSHWGIVIDRVVRIDPCYLQEVHAQN
jgi:hypothetical protein